MARSIVVGDASEDALRMMAWDEDEFDEFKGVYGSPVIPLGWRYCDLKGGITRTGDGEWGVAGLVSDLSYRMFVVCMDKAAKGATQVNGVSMPLGLIIGPTEADPADPDQT